MLGRVLNTHQQWLCRQLADRGYAVDRQVAVSDAADTIAGAVREALDRADLILTTGGLGPTSDDRTRDAIAALFGRRLVEDPEAWARIERWYRDRGRTPLPSIRLQALVPEGAVVLHNQHGTAPGLILEAPAERRPTGARLGWLVMLPGPPRELQPMFSEQVLPWLRRSLPVPLAFVCRTLRTTGVPESTAQHQVEPTLSHLIAAGLEVGYCARPGEVDIRLSARTGDAGSLVAQAEAIVRERMAPHLFGEEDQRIEEVVVRRLTEARRTLVVAESCTGGRLASRVTDVPGASVVFLGGLITYSNALKERLLGVRAETLATHGAVSEATALEMADGARTQYGADYALSVTGIAGPTGGTETKPVGTVFMALSAPGRTVVRRQLNRFDRETFKQMTSQQALELLRQELEGLLV